MFIYFQPDTNIPFDQLTDGRLEKYDIKVQVSSEEGERRKASLTCSGSKLLVRTNRKNMIWKLIPIEIDITHVGYVLDAIGFEFDTVCSTEYDGPYKYVREDIEAPD